MELDLTGLVLPQRIEVTQRSDDGRQAQFVAIARDVFVYIYKRLSDEPPTEARVEAEAA